MLAWGTFKNNKGQIVVHYTIDEDYGSSKPVRIVLNEPGEGENPEFWYGSWSGKGNSGDAVGIFLHKEYYYQYNGCYDTLGN